MHQIFNEYIEAILSLFDVGMIQHRNEKEVLMSQMSQ